MSTVPELQCLVAAHRRAAGLSCVALAERVGLSRQALAAIEAGRATPSTAVALRLARALDCRVEELFALPAEAVPGVQVAGAEGGRVVLGRVEGRWVAHPLDPRGCEPADGLVLPGGGVEALVALPRLEQVALVAGCAPVLGVLAGQRGAGRGGEARWIQSASGAALRALAEGRVHVAGLHLAGHDAPQEHDGLVRAALPGVELWIVSLVLWREGLATAPGNPLDLRGPGDLARPGLRVGQRPAGSGAAKVLEAALARVGLGAVRGPAVATHLDAAHALVHGAADAAVLIEPVAEAFGLPFLPMREERFELVLRAADVDHPGVARLLDQLSSPAYAREVRGMGAYDVGLLGQVRTVAAA